VGAGDGIAWYCWGRSASFRSSSAHTSRHRRRQRPCPPGTTGCNGSAVGERATAVYDCL